MLRFSNFFSQLSLAKHFVRWTILSVPIAVAVGSAVALFLWLLELATQTRYQNPWLLWLLPVAGILIFLAYKYLGKNSEAGNNLIIDEIHEPGGGVPLRMTPLVLFATVITHLFGGSAGREGTAVQMGGSLAQWFARRFALGTDDVKTMLMIGVAAGFGAVFGTPVTGAIFALEVLIIGRLSHQALIPCLTGSLLADIVCNAWGAQHTHYHINVREVGESLLPWLHFDLLLLGKVVAAGILFGIAAWLFSEAVHGIKHVSHRFIAPKWVIPAVGGIIIIILTYSLGTTDYLGLGVTNPNPDGVSIVSSFTAGGAEPLSWFWKLLFTVVTLGMGFKGGEVTPLFFIGAALGNTIAAITGAPVDLLAGLGFIAVLAAATNTPIACTIMGVELFGGDHILYYAVACFIAYYFSGHSGIYQSQRLFGKKQGGKHDGTAQTLKEIRERKMRARELWRRRK